jgi:hypothetical protein
VCTNGKCASSCASSQTLCNGACVDTQSDSSNCGSCGNACPYGQTCSTGTCTNICTNTTTTYCFGTCVNEQTDNLHCGSCGHSCTSEEHCVSAKCQCTPSAPLCGSVCCPMTKSCVNNTCT